MRRRNLVAVAGLAAIALTGCGEPISEGTLVKKSYSPESTYTYFMCAGYNSQGVCTVNMPMTGTNPESWNLLLENTEGETGWRYTNEEYYNKVQIGDHVVFNDD